MNTYKYIRSYRARPWQQKTSPSPALTEYGKPSSYRTLLPNRLSADCLPEPDLQIQKPKQFGGWLAYLRKRSRSGRTGKSCPICAPPFTLVPPLEILRVCSLLPSEANSARSSPSREQFYGNPAAAVGFQLQPGPAAIRQLARELRLRIGEEFGPSQRGSPSTRSDSWQIRSELSERDNFAAVGKMQRCASRHVRFVWKTFHAGGFERDKRTGVCCCDL